MVLPLPLPPTFLLPWRARLYSSTTTSTLATGADTTPESLQAAGVATYRPLTTTPQAPSSTITAPASSAPPTPLSLDPTITTLLPLLAAQTPHYITAHLHARPYLLTAGDTLRLPFYMHGVKPGDVLRLNRAANLGSRDYTLKGAPYLDERLFECRATVVGVESEPMRVKEKTKRRQRRVKRVKSKMRYTVLRVSEVRVRGLEELSG
jgi:large subunit ribosomal protein L21